MNLPDSVAVAIEKLIDRVCDEFEAAWLSGEHPRMEDYLPRVAADHQSLLLLEVLKVELAHRFEVGEKPSQDDYVRRFVDHADAVREAFSSVVTSSSRELCEAESIRDFASRKQESTHRGNGRRPRVFGHYELVEELARGGMGVVYRARDVDLGRTVALKLIGQQYLSSAEAIQRFQAEAHAAASLDHPSIVSIYEVDQHDGQHYLAMPLVEGDSLAGLLHDGPMKPRDAAELLRGCALALDYAHQRGVIHRDVKPANILLDSAGAPRITDFGLAKMTDATTGLTASGEVLGTPSYMPPEQAIGGGDVDPTADVYSLGAVLYCQLTGRPPFQAATALETLKLVESQDPVPPRRLNPAVDKDLDTICIRCLEKEPGRRYATARELADDLGRWLSHEPIHARPLGLLQRTQRWCRRKPWRAVAIAGMLATICAAVATLWYVQVTRSKAESEVVKREAAERIAETNRFFVLLNEVESHLASRELGWKARSLEAIRQAAKLTTDIGQLIELRSLAASCLAGVDLVHQRTIAPDYHAFCLTYSPDGEHLAVGEYSASLECSVRIYEVDSGELFHDIRFGCPEESRKAGVRVLVYSPDGNMLAAGTRNGMVHLWNTATLKLDSHRCHEGTVTQAQFSHDGQKLVTCSTDGTVRLWDVKQWKEIASHNGDSPCSSVAFAAGSENTLSFVSWKGIQHLEFDDGPQPKLRSVNGVPELNNGRIRYGADGRLVVATTGDHQMSVRTEVAKVHGASLNDSQLFHQAHTDDITNLALTNDATLIITGSWDQTFKLWDVAAGQVLLKQNTLGTSSVFPDFRPNQKQLAVTTEDGVQVYGLDRNRICRTVASHPLPVVAVALSVDGERLACISRTHGHHVNQGGYSELTIWDESGELIESCRIPEQYGGKTPECFDADFSPVDVASLGLGLQELPYLFSRGQLEPLYRVADRYVTLRFSPDGEQMVGAIGAELVSWSAADMQEQGRWSNAEAKAHLGRGSLTSLAVGRRFTVVGSGDDAMRVFQLRSDATTLLTKCTAPNPVRSVGLAQNESVAWLGTSDGTVESRALPDGELLWHRRLHRDRVNTMAVGPGNLVVTGSQSGNVALWKDTSDGPQKLLWLRSSHGRPVVSTRLSRDGRKLAIVYLGETAVRLWDLKLLNEKLAELGVGSPP